jgi:hypothetical protein
VAGRFEQREGEEFEETLAPIIEYDAARIISV